MHTVLSFRLPFSMKRQLESFAVNQNLTSTDVIKDAIASCLDEVEEYESRICTASIIPTPKEMLQVEKRATEVNRTLSDTVRECVKIYLSKAAAANTADGTAA